MRQELVPEALAAARPLDETGDVDEFDDRGRHGLRLEHRGENLQPLVRNRDDPDVGIDRTERIVGRFRSGRGERVEERRLADVR
jgi:hypothetical protein